MKALLTNILNNFDKLLFVVLVVLLTVVIVTNTYKVNVGVDVDVNVDTSKEDAKIDSIKDSIQYSEKQIIKLDSLKNEYLNKESALSDTAAINLFYWLLSR